MLLFIFIASTAVQIGFWGIVFARIAGNDTHNRRQCPGQPHALAEPPPFVSVIICARNEADNLKKNLRHFLNQSYRFFEVIVVNDNSTDNTADVVLDSMAKWPNLRLVNLVQDTPPGKKAALAKGIEAAQGNYLLLSDADCRPGTDGWIAVMLAKTNTIFQISLGFSPYDRQKGLLNLFIRYETAYSAVQYMSLAMWGMPYMGVGRNLMYTRAVFEQAGGFEQHRHIASGDDDLLVNAVAAAENTTVVLDPGTFVYSTPEKSWRGYYNQKKRHISTGRSYKPLHQLVLGALSASHFFHYAGALAGLWAGVHWYWIAGGVLLRSALVITRWRGILRRFRQEDLLPWVIGLDVLFLAYYVLLTPALFAGKRNRWI